MSEQPPEIQDARELARRMLRQRFGFMFVGIQPAVAAAAAVILVRWHLPDRALPVAICMVLLLLAVASGALFLVWRSPPAALVESFVVQIEHRRKLGKPTAPFSRAFLVFVGALCFAFAMAVGFLYPIPH